MKPKIKFADGQWMCGGLPTSPWYIDWVIGDTPLKAYLNWERITK